MKSSTIKTLGLVFGLILITSTNAFGQSQNGQQKTPPTFSELLKEMDANDDGKLESQELKGPLKEDFEKIDLDEDGFITEEELEKAPKPKRKQNR